MEDLKVLSCNKVRDTISSLCGTDIQLQIFTTSYEPYEPSSDKFYANDYL